VARTEPASSATGGEFVPTDVRPRARPILSAEQRLIALASILPWLVSMLLAHAYPAIAGAFVLVGRLC
jgi:hypothetical protein